MLHNVEVYFCQSFFPTYSGLQIRGGIEDKAKIIFLISQ